MELEIEAHSPLATGPKLHNFPVEFDPFDHKIFGQAYCILGLPKIFGVSIFKGILEIGPNPKCKPSFGFLGQGFTT